MATWKCPICAKQISVAGSKPAPGLRICMVCADTPPPPGDLAKPPKRSRKKPPKRRKPAAQKPSQKDASS